ncbi:MAG: glycosyltransferase [Chloroflexota bacterium]
MKLAVFSADRWEHVCPTLRILSPAEQAGFTVIRGNDWENDQLKTFPAQIAEADLVVIQRDFPSHIEAYEQIIAQAHTLRKPVIYELDDLLTELPDEHPDFARYLAARPAILRAVVEADSATGSTPFICDYLRAFNPNTRLWPNYLDDRLWALSPINKPEKQSLTIGYMGGHSHIHDLELVTPILLKLLQDYAGQIQLQFWGVAPPVELQHLPNVRWDFVGLLDYRQFAGYFSRQVCDIFIAPLQDNLFNRCKSHLKFLEYSSLGVPGVYSQPSPYEHVVIPGINGFLASTPDEWESHLSALIENLDLRQRMGLAALETVRKDWLLSSHVTSWAALYQGFLQIDPVSNQPSQAHSVPIVAVAQKALDFHKDLERRLTQARLQLDELDLHNRALAEQISNLDNQLHARDQQIGNLMQERDGIDQQRLALQSEQTALQERIQTLVSEADEKERVIHQKDERIQHLDWLYQDIMQSRSWKLARAIVSTRTWFIPVGSQREQAVKTLYYALKSLRNNGPSGTLRYIRQNWRAAPIPRSAPQYQPQTVPIDIQIDTNCQGKCSLPAISILHLLQADQAAEPPLQAIMDWLNRQTLAPAAEIIVWDKSAGQAWPAAGAKDQTWPAPDLRSLLDKLATRYICIASSDLLQQHATFLEQNLVVLESESLAFTVNLNGRAEWAVEQIEQGFLPGDSQSPLLRQVIARDCLQDGFTLDLSAWLDRQPAAAGVAGKIIHHTTANPDQEHAFPCKARLANVESLVQEHSILARMGTGADWGSITHTLRPVDDIVPIVPRPSDIPTSIMVHPFLAVGGAEQISLQNMRHLQDQIRFALLTFEDLDPALGTTADAYRQVTPWVYMLPNFLHPALYWSFQAYLIKRLQVRSMYIANGTTWIYHALPEIKRQFPNIRIANQVYDSVVGWINRYDLSLVTYIDAHLAPNPKIREAYIQKGVKPENTYVIENGVDPEEINPASYTDEAIDEIKSRLGLKPGKKIVTFASRLHFQKRPMDFVELARRFSSDETIEFLMVGDGPLADTVEEQVAKIKLGNFRRRKFYRPISDILAVTDALVLPSEFEGMPMIITEALAMGKPVVATDVGNNREVLERTHGGIVISKIGDIGMLKDALRQLLDAPPEPEALRQKALAYWDVALIAQQLRDALIG